MINRCKSIIQSYPSLDVSAVLQRKVYPRCYPCCMESDPDPDPCPDPYLSCPTILTLTVTFPQIQSVVRDPRPERQERQVARKANPFRYRNLMQRLNPHHNARVKGQAEYQEAQKAKRKELRKERRKFHKAGKEFYAKANLEGDIKF